MRSVKSIIDKKSRSRFFSRGLKTAAAMRGARLILNNFFPATLQKKFEIYYFDLKKNILTIKTFNPTIASEIRLNEPKIQNLFKKRLKLNLKKILLRSY